MQRSRHVASSGINKVSSGVIWHNSRIFYHDTVQSCALSRIKATVCSRLSVPVSDLFLRSSAANAQLLRCVPWWCCWRARAWWRCCSPPPRTWCADCATVSRTPAPHPWRRPRAACPPSTARSTAASAAAVPPASPCSRRVTPARPTARSSGRRPRLFVATDSPASAASASRSRAATEHPSIHSLHFNNLPEKIDHLFIAISIRICAVM